MVTFLFIALHKAAAHRGLSAEEALHSLQLQVSNGLRNSLTLNTGHSLNDSLGLNYHQKAESSNLVPTELVSLLTR